MGQNERIFDIEGEEIVPSTHKLKLGGTVDVAKAVFPDPGAEVTITMKGTVEGISFDHKGPEDAKEWVQSARITGTKLVEITSQAPEPKGDQLSLGDDGAKVGETVGKIVNDLAKKRGEKK